VILSFSSENALFWTGLSYARMSDVVVIALAAERNPRSIPRNRLVCSAQYSAGFGIII
jgi:hypothetical protein